MIRRRTRYDPADAGQLKVVPVRHPARWVAVAVVAVLVAMLVHTLFFSYVKVSGVKKPRQRFEWSIIDHYFFSSEILHGLLITAELTVVSMAIGLALGLLAAVMRLSPNPLLSSSAWLYIWLFRGTPVLVQIYFWGYLYYIFPVFGPGVPFGPMFFQVQTTSGLSLFVIGALALGFNEGAYMSEIVRAGMVAVDEGQAEAALSLGLSRLQALRHVVLPQAMRVIVPPTGNETISMLKTTSLVSAIGLVELTEAAQNIAASNYKPIPLLMVAAIWYLIVTTVMMVGQYYVERYYARGSSRSLPPTPLERLRRGLLIRPGAGYGRFPMAVGVDWPGPPGNQP